MPPRFYKHKLLLDEGLFRRQSLKRINSRYNIKHISHDLNKGGIKDSEVYNIARKEKRVIITYNIDDFKKLVKQSKDTGIIGVTQAYTPDQVDTKLNSLLSKSSEKAFYGKYTALSHNK
jgi:predicted nuclease of predicted toxin-antitoxin system